MRNRSFFLIVGLLACLFFIAPPSVRAEGEDLASLDIEELMDVDVVTASRRAEPLYQVAGAVTVLDEEDIFHSGATTLPEVLKLVPGVYVEQMDLDRWAVGMRGFNGLLSNKHLVMIDGRPVTSPTSGGVDWGHLVPLAIVKRIEVVMGTWTHLWGVDSFTGVINIITKTAEETQDGLSQTTAGTSGINQLLGYGGEAGDTVHYRVYANGGYTNGGWTTETEDKQSSSDWRKKQVGTRVDWVNAFTDTLSFQGDLSYSSIEDGAFGAPPHVYEPHDRDIANGYAQFSWDRALGLDSSVAFRSSYTHSETTIDDLTGATNTIDAELQYADEQKGIHRFTWGLGGRYYWDDIQSGPHTSIEEDRRYTFNANGYIQDRITLSEDSLYLILGTKLDYLGQDPLEFQPTVRLLQTMENQELWLAVSRAVRADTRWQRSGSYTIHIRGNDYTVIPPDSLTTEKLISYEAGYRNQVLDDLRWDTSIYINDYDELAMLVVDDATKTASLSNSLKGTAYGMETMLEWGAADWLTLIPSAGLIYQNLYGLDGDPVGESVPEDGFTYTLKLQSRLKFTPTTGFDLLTGYVDGPGERNMPGYLFFEAHAWWKATDSLMLELLGRNLSEAFYDTTSLRVGPSLDLRATWKF